MDQVLNAIDDDRNDLVALCLSLGNLRDYPGEERAVGEAALAWLQEAGIEGHLQWLGADSVNLVGLLRGTGDRAGGGRSLIFNAHMDTQGGVPDGGPEAVRRIRGAFEAEGMLHGRGLANDKAQLAAEMIAVRAIKNAGVRLKEDLYVTGVAQETMAPPAAIEDFASWSGIGPSSSQIREGHGARWLVEHGVVADYALVGEVSDFTMTVAQAGYLRLRIAIEGNVAYTPGLRRGPAPGDSPNPFERAAPVLSALEGWARDFETAGRFAFWGGTLAPRAQVHEIRPAGLAWTNPRDHCFIYFDIRLVPDARPAEVIHSVRQAVARSGVACAVSAYDYKRGYVADGAEKLIEALKAAHETVTGDALAFAGTETMGMWRDANAFNEGGIPAIGYGPPTKISDGGRGEAGATRPIAIDDLVVTAKVFALTALEICGVAETAG